MGLWIRSQDKKHLINCEALMLEQVGTGKWGIRVFSKNYDYNICNYETKERALEVLDEIQRLITDLQYMSYAIPNNKFTGYRPNVYEMPEE